MCATGRYYRRTSDIAVILTSSLIRLTQRLGSVIRKPYERNKKLTGMFGHRVVVDFARRIRTYVRN